MRYTDSFNTFVSHLIAAWNPLTSTPVLVTELMAGGSLHSRVHDANYVPSLRFARATAQQVARGLVYLHKRQLIHRDLVSFVVVDELFVS